MARSKRKDPDQDAVYHAEEIVFSNTLFEEPLHSDDLLHLADELFSHDWWEQFNIPTPTIEPTTSRDTTSSAQFFPSRSGGDALIRIAPHQVTPRILAHEAAHVAQDYFYSLTLRPDLEDHGREFRSAYLVVAEILLGRQAALNLADAFARFVPQRPEHAPGQKGWVVTLPRNRTSQDPERMGIYPAWRLRQQMEEADRLRKNIAAWTPSPTDDLRIGGAIAL